MKFTHALIGAFALATSACHQGESALDEKTNEGTVFRDAVHAIDASVPDILGLGQVQQLERYGDAWNTAKLVNQAKPALAVRWSENDGGLIRLQDEKSNAWIEVHPQIDGELHLELARGHVVQRGGGPDGGDVFYRVHSQAVEDFVVINDPSTAPTLEYEVTLGEGIVALRQIEDVVEFLDVSGTPRFRIPPPYAIDAEDQKIPVHMTIHGCAYDHDARPPWQRPIVPAGSRTCMIHANWNRDEATYPILVDPAWSLTNHMAAPRAMHTATLLPTGQVLVIGGANGVPFAEIFDPNTETWAVTGSTAVIRQEHTATVVDGQGSVLVVGSISPTQSMATEMWSPQTGLFTTLAPLATGRHSHVAVAFRDGSKTSVLVAGGIRPGGTYSPWSNPPLAQVEIWDSHSMAWKPLPNLVATRGAVAASLLSDGRTILFSGGSRLNSPGTYPAYEILKTAELYDAISGTAEVVGKMQTEREGHTQTLLMNDGAVVVGGSSSSNYAEVFDRASGTWSIMGNVMAPRKRHTTTLLDTGELVVAGGTMGLPTTSQVSVFHPLAKTWSIANSMTTARQDHTATLLDNGAILVAGGRYGSWLDSAELY